MVSFSGNFQKKCNVLIFRNLFDLILSYYNERLLTFLQAWDQKLLSQATISIFYWPGQ